jgi:hypothetical protein
MVAIAPQLQRLSLWHLISPQLTPFSRNFLISTRNVQNLLAGCKNREERLAVQPCMLKEIVPQGAKAQ